MPNEVFIKICGITNVEDARSALSLGADAIGFVFAQSRRQVSVEQVAQILDGLPESIQTFGVFVDETVDRVARIVTSLGLSGAQLHGNESPAEVDSLCQKIPLVIKAIPIGETFVDLVARYPDVWAILGDGPQPGSGMPPDWGVLRHRFEQAKPASTPGSDARGDLSRAVSLRDRALTVTTTPPAAIARPAIGVGARDPDLVVHAEGPRLILAGGLRVDNVRLAMQEVRPDGVDVSSGVEQAPGRKDPRKMRAFIDAVRSWQ
jgi:phosphoribosylanthranilate isomerase